MKTQHPRTTNGHARSRSLERLSSTIKNQDLAAYVAPSAAAMVGAGALAALGYVLRSQVATFGRAVARGLWLDDALDLCGLQRRSSFAMRFGPAAGGLALGLAAGGCGAWLLSRREQAPGAREQRRIEAPESGAKQPVPIRSS